MVRNLVLQADRLMAELIVSDIPNSGKAFLRGLEAMAADGGESAMPAAGVAGRSRIPVADGFDTETAALEHELASLIETARKLAESLGATTLQAGFRPDGPLPGITPQNPPPGMQPYTGFVRLTAVPAALAAAPTHTPAVTPAGSTADVYAASAPAAPAAASWRRVRLTPDRIALFLELHRDGMAGVPNVPTLSEADVLETLKTDQIDLIMLDDGADQAVEGAGRKAEGMDHATDTAQSETAVGFIDLRIDADAATADLEEIAILPAWRSHGIGRAVIRTVAGELAAAGIQKLSIVVATVNAGALRLYESLGFGSPELFSHWFQMPVRLRKTVRPFHTQAELAADLRRLGVRSGDTLMVHSSLKSLGWVPGGAVALIAALDEVLGPTGTLVMAAQSGENSDPANWVSPPVPAEWWPRIRESMPAYEPAVTPVDRIGRVADLFRTLPGVRRSAHPSVSFAARGPLAADILADHTLAAGLGDGSPNARLVERDARILQIGTDYDTCTVIHLAEYQTGCRLRLRHGSAMLVDGRRQWVDYDDLQTNSDEFIEPGRLLESRGQVVTGKVGEANCRLFRAADAVAAARDWFSGNRMRRLGEADRGWLMDLLQREPEFNLFMIGDIENYGFDEPFQDIMAFNRAPQANQAGPRRDSAAGLPDAPNAANAPNAPSPADIDSIVLRYYTNFIVYSTYDDFRLDPVLSALDYPSLTMLSAKKAVMERLKPHLPGYRFSDTFMMKRPTTAVVPVTKAETVPASTPANAPAAAPIELAALADAEELAAFLFGVAEFAVANQTLEEKTSAIKRSLAGTGTRYVVIRENGRIVACAGTTAENSQSAMVVSVATDLACRRRGYATRLVSRLCELHAAEGRAFLCLFYSNPNAGLIYRGLGFTEIGTWVMARPPVRLTGQGV